MATRPTDKPLFALTASGTDIQQPDSSHQGAGWVFREKPPYEYLNWLMKSYHDWIDYTDAASCEMVQGFECARLSTSVFVGEGRARGIGGAKNAIVRTASMEKSVGTWVLGDGNGGVPAAQFPWTPDSWKHYFVIKRDSDGVVDAGFDSNLDASVLLAATGFDQYRRVCSVYLVDDVSDFIRSFNHNLNDDSFVHTNEQVQDYSTPVSGITTIPLLKGTPPGLTLPTDMHISSSGITSAWTLLIEDGFTVGGGIASGLAQRLQASAGLSDHDWFRMLPDTSQQIYVEVFGTSTPPLACVVDVRGYVDKRYVPWSTWY